MTKFKHPALPISIVRHPVVVAGRNAGPGRRMSCRQGWRQRTGQRAHGAGRRHGNGIGLDRPGERNVNLPERRLRFRHMEIQPGGVVPLHSHADRPALIMVNQGQIFENSSKCTVPILHKTNEISREFLGVKHWWKNESTVVVVLTIADIVNDKKPDTMMKNM